MAPVRRNATPLPADTAEPKKSGRKVGRRPSAAVAAERKALAIRRHAEKAAPEQIASETGVALQTLKNWMRDKVAFPPHPPEPVLEPAALDPQVELAAILRAAGKSFGEIVKATGLTHGRLSWIMKNDRARFPARDASERARAAASRRRAGMERPTPSVEDGPAAVDDTPVQVDEAPIPVDAAPVRAPGAPDPVDVAPVTARQEIANVEDAGLVQASDDRPERADAFRPLRGFAPMPLVDALAASCRWPIYPDGRSEAGVAVHCCGRATGDLKRSYCETHAKMARGAGSSAERAAHRLPGRALAAAGGGKPFFASAATGA
ncbi:GcrA family cell cycle regulator [Antarcticirhabdus aurantiaca]|uniref:Uncharacterized protein n=1 Tax=Antarcticirhabdus aurantiaca TaxID=2606717 RepID=A0ACD4NJ99_9HYPH|nr:hypothetical protein OXU80_18740 [Jeongeuplla avenae]